MLRWQAQTVAGPSTEARLPGPGGHVSAGRARSGGPGTVVCAAAASAPPPAGGGPWQTCDTSGGEWRSYAGDVRGTKYSPPDQIDARNFADLEIAWEWTSVD